jgi:ribokinase
VRLGTLLLSDGFPGPNQKWVVSTRVDSGGGPVPNALAVFSRLGGKAAFIGAVGDRQEGLKIRCDLEKYGVDVSRMILRPDRRSACAFIWIDLNTGDRTVALDPGDVKPVTEEELPEDWLRNVPFLLTDGRYPDVVIRAAGLCRENGGTVVLDAGSPRPRITEILAVSDHAVVSQDFILGTYPNLSADQALQKIAEAGPRSVVITRGEKGGIWFEDGVKGDYNAFPVEVVDTTGAGDAFHGAYLYGLKRGWDMPERCRFASGTAAMVCRGIGGKTAAPTYDEGIWFISGATSKSEDRGRA